MLVVLGALREEITDLRRRMIVEGIFPKDDNRIYQGKYANKDILLAQTGIGRQKAERATEFILDHYPVTALICLGFAGALARELKVGDVVLITTLYSGDEPTNGDLIPQIPGYSDTNLVSIAAQSQESKGSGFLQASSITVVNPVSEPKAKLALGEASHAKVVDMESYWIARLASAKNIPFLSIRAVSDTVDDRLPPFDRLLNSGSWQWGRATLYFLTHPQQLTNLFHLYRNARQARRSLTAFMDSFIVKLEIDREN